jgi:2-polyprenyl-3-methyl-5-hydroxy-6-metoxy-1,4-benzoquinol methylase
MFNKDERLSFNFNSHSPHVIVTKLISEGTTVLDVGCNTGYIGKYLIENKGCIVDGVDIEKLFLDEAKKNGYRKVFQIDLYDNNFLFVDDKYDYILLVDILEHLPSPARIFSKFIDNNLKTDGRTILSLPNIARMEYRVKHLMGNFDYEKSGIMHQDHLRFFTKKTSIDMIEKCGCEIKNVIPTGLGHKLNILTNLTAFQFIFICAKGKK